MYNSTQCLRLGSRVSLCSPARTWIHRDQPASASWVLGLQVCMHHHTQPQCFLKQGHVFLCWDGRTKWNEKVFTFNRSNDNYRVLVHIRFWYIYLYNFLCEFLFVFGSFCLLRQGYTIYPRLALNLLQSSCFRFQHVGITIMHHHTWFRPRFKRTN